MKAYTKDIIKTIVKGKKRFLALMLITALGVCMQCGLKAACDDLRISADHFFDEQNLFDISIVSTLGLTQEDVKVLSRLPGIDDVEGGYSETVLLKVEGQTKQAAVYTLSEKDINVPYVLEGTMPMREDEILVTKKYLSESGKSIGDVIVIEEDRKEEELKEEDTEEEVSESEDVKNRFELELDKADQNKEESDKDESSKAEDIEISVEEEKQEPNFLYTEYTIVGVVVDVMDVNSSEGAVSFRANTTTDYVFFVLPEAIQSDIFTAVYITLTGADELLCYSDEYEARVDEIVTILEEEIKADREKSRYDEIKNEALDKIEDAENEMNDKFEDAESEILDAKLEIEDGWSELLKGQEELLKGEKEIAEAERKLAKAQRELESAQRELDAAKSELAAAWEELETGEFVLLASEEALKLAESALKESEEALDQLEAELPEQFNSTRAYLEAQILSVQRNIMQAEAEILLLEYEVNTLKTLKETLPERLWGEDRELELKEKEAELVQTQEELEQYKEELKTYEDTLAGLEQEEENAETSLGAERQALEERKKELEESRKELEANKKELEAGRKELEKAQKEYDKGKKKVDNGWKELEDGYDALEEAYKKLEDGRSELEDGQEKFEDGKQQYEDSVSEYEDKKQQALDKLEEARKEIEGLKMTEWYITTRTGLSGYNNIKTDAVCIESIGNAFPILFLTVAILISLTTISRMVEEDRGLIGTYKALGFTDKEIRRKYVVYALLACMFGGILGNIFGFVVLPEILFWVFGIMYDLPYYQLAFDVLLGIGAILLFIAGIAGAAFVSCNTTLVHMPAVLMRPKAPKNGSRVWLERITPVWSKMSFLNKVTARNLFRYKKRLFMTLFGIAGCTSILLAGYTIKDTIIEMMPLQYEKTTKYDLMVVADDPEQMLKYMEEESTIRSYIRTMISNVKITNEEGREETVQLVVLAEGESLRGYVNLYDKHDNKLRLEDGDIFTTINVANILGYTVDDTVTMQMMQLETADVEVTGITMNYLGNYVYMTQKTYEEYFGEFKVNSVIALMNGSEEAQEEFAEKLSARDGILSVIASSSFEKNSDTVFKVINLVVTIVIVLAAALAFVVLFTLSTTNISERERELATIKVLGFYDREVHLYVNKETIILTSIGILLGMPLGKVFGVWLMSILQMPSIYFSSTLYPISYLIAGVIALTFALIVNFITDRSLDKINPVEALKSIE